MGKGSKDGVGVGSIEFGEDDHQNGSIMIKELKFEVCGFRCFCFYLTWGDDLN